MSYRPYAAIIAEAVASVTVEYRTLSPGEATAKSLTLSSTPSAPSEVTLAWEGVAQFYGDDFTVSGSTLSWSGTDLDDKLVSGDRLVITYKT